MQGWMGTEIPCDHVHLPVQVHGWNISLLNVTLLPVSTIPIADTPVSSRIVKKVEYESSDFPIMDLNGRVDGKRSSAHSVR